jgi:putative protease
MSSKDLCLIERLEEYIDAGVNAFKIEGRMKSIYHAANTTRIYKHAARKAGTDEFKKFLPFWLEELNLISHRPYTTDLFNEFGRMGYDGIPYINNALFVAYRSDQGEASCEVTIKTFNPVYKDEVLDGIYPIKDEILDDKYKVLKIFLEESEIEMGRPNNLYRVLFDKPVLNDAIFRRRLENRGDRQ